MSIKKIEAIIVAFFFAALLALGGIVFMAFDRVEYISTKQLQTTPTDVHNLIKEELYLRETINAFGYCILEANGEGTITRWDSVASALWGYRPDEVIGQRVEFLMAEKAKPVHEERFYRAMRKGEGLTRDGDCELARHKEGYLFPVQIEIRVLGPDRVIAIIKGVNNTA